MHNLFQYISIICLQQWTVFISQDETMSELKERLHIEQFRTVVFVNR